MNTLRKLLITIIVEKLMTFTVIYFSQINNDKKIGKKIVGRVKSK